MINESDIRDMSDQEKADEEAATLVIQKLEQGARDGRLMNAREEFALARHCRLLRAINATLLQANQDLLDQMKEAGLDAMGLHGYRGDADT